MFMRLFNKLKKEVGEWSEENFPGQPVVNPFMGSSEEAGELAECLDADSSPDDEELDAVGDILVYMADFCYKRDLDYQKCYEMSQDVNNKYEDFFREWVRSRGQLTRSVLKREQGIRLDEDRVGDKAEEKALASMISCLERFAESRGYNLEDAIRAAWYEEVIDREWNSSYREN